MLRHLHEALRGEKIVDKRYHALVRGHFGRLARRTCARRC